MLKLKYWLARSLILSAAPIVEYLSRFARTIVLSRLLAHEEFGISAAIGVLVGVIALITDISLDKFAMQIDMHDRKTLATVHMLSIVRGILIALILFFAAPAIAALFGVPNAVGSFSAMALYPLLSGFTHFRIKQIQRNYLYGPESIAQVAAFSVAFMVVFPAIHFFNDNRAIVVSYLAEAGIYTAASHVLARTPYQLWPNPQALRSALKFGLPLLANGFGLAVLSQLDRVLVGSWLGVATLANYTVILTLSVIPATFILRVFTPMVFSALLQAKDDTTREDRQALLVFFSDVLGISYAFFVALTLDWLTPIIFGPSFHVARSVHILLVVIIFLRMVRYTAPTVFLLATERTKELATLNLSAGMGLVFALVLLRFRVEISSVLFGVCIGEFISFLLFFRATYLRVFTQRRPLLIDAGLALITLGAIVGAVFWLPQLTWQARGTVLIAGLIGIATQVVVGFRKHKIFSLFFGEKEV